MKKFRLHSNSDDHQSNPSGNEEIMFEERCQKQV